MYMFIYIDSRYTHRYVYLYIYYIYTYEYVQVYITSKSNLRILAALRLHKITKRCDFDFRERTL